MVIGKAKLHREGERLRKTFFPSVVSLLMAALARAGPDWRQEPGNVF